MHKFARVLSGVAVLAALGALFLATARGRDDDDDKEKAMKTAAARVAVLKLVGDLGGKDDDLKKEAADVAIKHDIEFVMNQFKPRDKGGLGVGPAPGTAKYDGIETELLFLGKKAMPPKDFAAQQAALKEMAEVSLAIAEVTPNYAPKKDEAGMPIKDWLKFADDMKKQSRDLIDALKGGDPKMVQDKANILNGSCDACHTEFRDK